MSRKIYHTDGIVLSSRPQGESNRLLLIFTEQLGLLKVRAQGVRELKSKMRLHLYDWVPLKLSLVRGRDTWHLTGVIAPSVPVMSKEVRSLWRRFGRLLIRLVPESARDAELYQFLAKGISFIEEVNTGKDHKALELAEILLVLRLLSHLGYLPKESRFSSEVWSEEWQPHYLLDLKEQKDLAVSLINQAIAASQL